MNVSPLHSTRYKSIFAVVLVALSLFTLVFFRTAALQEFGFGSSTAVDKFGPESSATSKILHVVLFEFKERATENEIKEVCDRMIALKDSCLHPVFRTPYLSSIVGGKDNSIEDKHDRISHAFVVEFANSQDRDFYLKQDPAHLAFNASIGGENGAVLRSRVVDFHPGVF